MPAHHVARHEKDLHWEGCVSRRLTSPRRRISVQISGEEATDDTRTSSNTPDPERQPTSLGQSTPGVSRILSGDPTERLLVSPDIASYASNPCTRIQQAIAALDFTTLHAEALSLNYMATPFPSPPPELEFMSTGQTSSEMQPFTPCGGTSIVPMSSGESERSAALNEARSSPPKPTPSRRQDAVRNGPGDTFLVPDEDILALGPVFDPLSDPVITKTAAINGYVADLHRKMMINAGLWGR
ncbi:hypothetical protein N7490_008322 [Penicillium lividum]|nr:hypothetical protein N7490_008322 [Penicillium lividum]